MCKLQHENNILILKNQVKTEENGINIRHQVFPQFSFRKSLEGWFMLKREGWSLKDERGRFECGMRSSEDYLGTLAPLVSRPHRPLHKTAVIYETLALGFLAIQGTVALWADRTIHYLTGAVGCWRLAGDEEVTIAALLIAIRLVLVIRYGFGRLCCFCKGLAGKSGECDACYCSSAFKQCAARNQFVQVFVHLCIHLCILLFCHLQSHWPRGFDLLIPLWLRRNYLSTWKKSSMRRLRCQYDESSEWVRVKKTGSKSFRIRSFSLSRMVRLWYQVICPTQPSP